ncbi:Equilibrative nucleoside transporter 3 [Halotydeus destructor]|nr:Equilibrative nucleoside transporter 3 [Halotydeus destructor]
MLMLGIGAVLPWNMFINANSYFVDYKLAQSNNTDVNVYRNSFLSYVGVLSVGPHFLIQLWNLFYHSGSNSLKMRIIITTVIQLVLMAVTVALAVVDSTSWPAEFFYVSMATIVVLNMASGVFQNSSTGVSARLPMSYTNAVVTGMSLGSLFAALASIASIALSPGPKTAAILFFTIVLVYLAILTPFCLFLYNNPFYKFYNNTIQADDTEILYDSQDDERHKSFKEKVEMYKDVLIKSWVDCFNTFLVFFVSFAIFPAVQVDILPVDDVVPKEYFTPLTTFFTFNFFALIGHMFVADIFPKPTSRFLWIPITLRFLFIPFFLFCNYQPLTGRSWPVWLHSDWIFWTGNVLFGFTSGYFSSLTMMYAPKAVSSDLAPVAGMMAGFALIAGAFAGVSTSFVWSYLIRID